jgi:Sulfotransferase family
LISRAYRFIFVHIPKTGGNSVSRALLPFTESRLEEAESPAGFGSGENFWTVDPVFGRDKHFTADHYASLMDTREYTFFATVRNPWDLMVSLYYFRKQTGTGNWQTHAPETFNKAEFRQFLRAGEPTQVSYLGGKSVRLMRFERLEQDFAALSQRLGLGALTLDKINASRRQRYQDVLDDDLAAEIGTLYAEDVRRFGYSFAGNG